ncbi:uncharacterized protein N7525_001113 [Penicillium rubens]|uniref:uncharacterized protein n=1 Tax=Penicillium rubens TaxID=1108849 RepID=UPI002A59E008|nr:uncharacterized protein N7525_001113 [Penicillium rubens]KAJ5843372.1 hypothetical protein N7525_001113 [Penicillium rubens]
MDKYASHLYSMNRLAQWTLARPEQRDNGDLPYYDKIVYDESGHFVMPPSDVRLSDALVFLVLSAAIPGRQRGARWPADFDGLPLVRGGHARQPDKLPSMFISSTVPVVHENTIILGVTHPTLSTASPKDDGWFISDFYAFNYLFKGLGMQQTWLTAVEPAKLVKKYGSFLHGNPYEERKICLSQELLDSDELSPVTVVSPARMIDQFLIEARRASELAKRTSAPLLLLIFCHGLPNFHLLLNNGDTQRGLSRPRLSSML